MTKYRIYRKVNLLNRKGTEVRRVLQFRTGRGKDSKVKLIEQVVNGVTLDKPNRTDRLEPKGKEVGQRIFEFLCVDMITSGVSIRRGAFPNDND